MANNFHLRRLCRGAILATTLPCSILHPSTTSAFLQSPILHHPSKQAQIITQPTTAPTPLAFQHRFVHSPSPQSQSQPPTSQIRMTSSSSNTQNKNYIDKLALILINSKNEHLVARSIGKHVFYTPGGKRESGESDAQALLRECREELSIDLSESQVDPYGTFEAQAYGKPEGTTVRMTCFRVVPRDVELEYEGLVVASEEVEELKWIDSTFDREKLTVTGIMILEDLKEKGLIG